MHFIINTALFVSLSLPRAALQAAELGGRLASFY